MKLDKAKVDRYREKYGLTVNEMATIGHISPDVIHKAGKRNISPATLEKLCNYLGCKAEELTEEEAKA